MTRPILSLVFAALLPFALVTPTAAQIDLHTVHVAPRGDVIVVYSKGFNTCGHLLTPNLLLTHTNNIFCTQGDFIGSVHPGTAFNTNFAVGNQVKLCHGNNYNQCSPLVTISSGVALSADRSTLSLQAGGTQAFTLDGGSAFAGRTYLLLGTASGTAGFAYRSHQIPLTPDGYFSFTLGNPNTFPLANSLGVLDGTGGATASLTLPPGLSSALIGLVLHHAFVVLTPNNVSTVSNPWPLSLVQ